MDRRNLLIKSLLIAAGIGVMSSVPNLIKNSVLYSPKELRKEELFSTDLHSLEKIIMTGNILTEENPKSLTKLHWEITQKSNINAETEKVKDEITGLVIKKIREFSKKTPSGEKLGETRDEIDGKYQKIRQIKEGKKVSFVNFKREVLVSSQDDFLGRGDSALKEFYKFNNYTSLIDSLRRNEKTDISVNWMYKTLINLSSDFLFISEASKISGVPIEEIVAFANLESLGREFAVGREGEINRFQLHPKYLSDIYRNALSQKNALSDYIRENTSEETLLEDLAKDSRLNIAIAVNLMKYLKDKTRTYYEYILAYNRGLGGALNLPSKTRRELENPERISERDKKRSVFGYYTNFLDAKKAFEQIRDHITGKI